MWQQSVFYYPASVGRQHQMDRISFKVQCQTAEVEQRNGTEVRPDDSQGPTREIDDGHGPSRQGARRARNRGQPPSRRRSGPGRQIG